MLVWYELFGSIENAIASEKRMEAWKHGSMEAWKHGSMEAWKRQWKINVIEEMNPQWKDLYETLNN